MVRALLAVVALYGTLCGACQAQSKLERLFSDPTTTWIPGHRDPRPPRPVETDLGFGYEFPCDFSLADPAYPRCVWDTVLEPEDLGAYASFAFRLHVTNAAAVKWVAIYLQSGTGWYYLQALEKPEEGWNEVVLDRQGPVRVQDQPAGWDKVDRLRLSVFQAEPSVSTVQIVGMWASTTRLPPAQRPLFVVPERDRELKPTVPRDATGRLQQTRMILDEFEQFATNPDRLLDRITRAGFNALMPCVWHGRGARYRSPTTALEPAFAEFYAGGKDPLADLIRKAHARGVEVHAWFCVSYRGTPDSHPEFATEGVPWFSDLGMGAYDLQDPAFRAFIVKEMVEFARRYEVDGLSLDFIRTQGVSYSAIARAAYQQRFGTSLDETRGTPTPEARQRLLEFQEAAVTDIVKGVREGLRQVRPKAILSVCGEPLPKPQLHDQGRNEWLWLERDLIDVAYAMDYTWHPDFRRFDEARATVPIPDRTVLMLGNYEYDWDGKVLSRAPEQVARLLDYALRKYPANGVALYYYNCLDDAQIEALRKGPFREPAVAHWTVRR